MKQTLPIRIVGHRGAHGQIPGNTDRSFSRALEHGVDEIETDCRMTRDGQVVQFHDPTYHDSNGYEHVVAERTLAELQSDLPGVLTLEALISLVNKRAKLMLEIKAGTPVKPIMSILKTFFKKGWTLEHFSIASFDFTILQEAHALLPDIDIVVLESWSSIRAVKRAKQLGTPYISINQQYLWWGVVRNLARLGYKLYCYPYPRTKLRFNHGKPRRWIKHGLYGIIADHPDMFR